MANNIWQVDLGRGPFIATAIHDGHNVRDELKEYMVLPKSERLREEDPYTRNWTSIAPNRIVVTNSRFEVDLNRPRENSVYRTPDDAWGLHIWNQDLPKDIVERSLAEYDLFYKMLAKLFGEMVERYGGILVFDLHTYNHRRDGPNGCFADKEKNPQFNLGTGTMLNRTKWAPVIECFQKELRSYDFPTGPIDIRENVKFKGGEFAKWTHARFPEAACVLSIEVKKFFMDEWSGKPDMVLIDAIGKALQFTVPGVIREFEKNKMKPSERNGCPFWIL